MATLFAYSLAAGLMLTLLHLSTVVALRGQTYHSLSRGVLLTCMVLALISPAAIYSVREWIATSPTPVLPTADMVHTIPPSVAVTAAAATDATPAYMQILLIIYSAGLAVAGGRLLLSMASIMRLIATSRRIGPHGRWTLLAHGHRHFGSFSWGHFILIPESEAETPDPTVLCHESAHLRLRHWADLLAAETVASLLWYWPSAWLLRRDLTEVHEFQADAAVIQSGADARTYQIMLLKKAAGTRFHSMACSLNHSNISKRIKMMLRKKSRPAARMRVALAVPAAALGVMALCYPAVASALGSVSEAKVTNFSAPVQAPADTVVTATKTVTVAMVTTDDDRQNDITEKTLLIVDGKTVPLSELSSIKHSDIESISSLHGDAADAYLSPESQADGVIIITTKKAADKTPEAQPEHTLTDKNIAIFIDGERATTKTLDGIAAESIESMSMASTAEILQQYLTEKEIAAGITRVLIVTLKH